MRIYIKKIYHVLYVIIAPFADLAPILLVLGVIGILYILGPGALILLAFSMRAYRDPFFICPSCSSRVIPRLDFRTKDRGYCPCCGEVLWRREGEGRCVIEPRDLVIHFWRAGDPAYCPDCGQTVTTLRDRKHRADYCSQCGLALKAELQESPRSKVAQRRLKPV